MYAIDDIRYPDDRREFDNYQDAESAAEDESIDDSFWGIWDDRDELVTIVYQGMAYRT